MNKELQTLLFELLNRAVRAALSTDPDTARSFGRLVGQTFRIDITLPPLTLYLIAEPDGFSLAPRSDQEPVVTIAGPLPAFARLAGVGSGGGVLSEGEVSMQGDAEAGQALQRLLGRLDLDWEELIARQMGDLPARKIGNTLRAAGDWARESADLGRENLSDYLTEERQLIAGAVAMQRLERAVSELRADTDRLAARVDRLAGRLDRER